MSLRGVKLRQISQRTRQYDSSYLPSDALKIDPMQAGVFETR